MKAMRKREYIETIGKKDIPGGHLAGDYCDTAFEDVDLSGQALSGCVFENCLFRSCNLSNTDVKGARFIDVRFEGSKLVGVNFSNADQMILDIAFHSSKLMSCNFTGLKMKRTEISACEIEGCFFEETFLEEADFSESRFTDTLFHQCDLRAASFRDARGYAIDPRENLVKKAIFSLPDALSLLAPFGIKIE